MRIVFSRSGLGVAALVAVSGFAAATELLPPLQDPVAEYERLAAGADGCASALLTLPVDLGDGTAFEAVTDESAGRLDLLYRMNFNQVTEGWNWHPEAQPDQEDYYRFKYLPLGSTLEDKGSYRFEDKIGEPQDVRVLRRYAYFFAFDNLYDFFPRSADDDAGFRAAVALSGSAPPRPAEVRMAVSARLAPPCLSDSTTFWKATHGSPVDFTLKKRYLLGRLETVWFYDAASRRILARLTVNRETRAAR